MYNHYIPVVMEPVACKSIAYDGDRQIGECDYRVTSDGWNTYHTEVILEYDGKGIAKRLEYKIVEVVEKAKASDIPICPYVAKVI